MVEDGYEFFAKRQLVTLFSAPNYCGEFDNAGAMMSVDETLMCSFQVHDTFHSRSLLSLLPPFPQIDIIGAMVIVWKARGKIIRSVLCSSVCNNCTQ